VEYFDVRSRVRVLMISEHYWPTVGGVQRHIGGIANELATRGFQVTILTSSDTSTCPRHERYGNSDVVRIPFGWDHNPLLVTLWMIRHHNWIIEHDIIHVHDSVPLVFWYAPLILFSPRRPVFATFHGFERDPVPAMYRVLRKIARRLVRKCICIGGFISRQYGTKCDKVSIGAAELPSLPHKQREGAVFVGRIEEDTGIIEHVKALGILGEKYGIALKLTICGAGSKRQDIADLASSKGVGVEFTGAIDDPKEIMNRNEFCLAGGYLSILEGMSLGLPVLGIARTPLKAAYLRAVIDQGGPMSIQTNPEGIAEEIARLIENPGLAAEISERGRAFVARMSWNRLAETYMILWKSQ
jgi:glycosyltransferase involved in cell wall biosynthesis